MVQRLSLIYIRQTCLLYNLDTVDNIDLINNTTQLNEIIEHDKSYINFPDNHD